MADVSLTSLVGGNFGVTLPENLTDRASIYQRPQVTGDFTGSMAERLRITGKLLVSSVLLNNMSVDDTKYKLIVDGVVVAQTITGTLPGVGNNYVYMSQPSTLTVLPPMVVNEYIAIEVQTITDTTMSVQFEYMEIK